MFTMNSKAPRTLLVLLAVIVVAHTVSAALWSASPFVSALWPLLFATLGVQALYGKYLAALVLRYLFYVLAVVNALLAVTSPRGWPDVAWKLVIGGLLLGTAIYLSRSKALAHLYQQNSVTKK